MGAGMYGCQVTEPHPCPPGALECQGGYQACPKIHVIRVVFQNQAMYECTSFRGEKTCKIGKKVYSYRQILERT